MDTTGNRRKTMHRFLIAALLGFTAVGTSSERVAAQTAGKPEKYIATAMNLGGGPSASGTVIIGIDRWSTREERAKLLTVLVQKGPEQLLSTLQDSPKVGYFRLSNSLAVDLRYAFESPLAEGGRRVVLVTDRPIGFQQVGAPRKSNDYPFTLIEIHFNKDNVGIGKMSFYTKIVVSKDKQTLELENYGTEPIRLTNVTLEK
jgi:hypothetical protein